MGDDNGLLLASPPAGVGNVAGDYAHHPKDIVPAPDSDLVRPDTHLKWYDIHRADRTISAPLRAEAHRFLTAETASGNLDISGELGFVVHHLCGESFYFLAVFTWRNANEMWETVYGRDTTGGGPFALVPRGTHAGVACVWELGAVLHEQQAWIRYLYSARDTEAGAVYLGDRFTGSV